MSAIINIYDSAFSNEPRKVKVQSGLKVEEIENLDWENTVIYANGFKQTKDYVIKDNDAVLIRQYPSGSKSSVATALGWIFMPVTSAIHYFTSGSDEGALMWIGRSIDQAILDAFKQENTSGSIGQGEQIPTISGAKNRSGAGQPIPLLIGQSMYTPITLAQAYTDINPYDTTGTDGENQYFHCLYCLGYKNIDLKSVSLGIYRLSADEKNGTSGGLNVTNYERRTIQDVFSYVALLSNAVPYGTNNYVFTPYKEGWDLVSIDNVSFTRCFAYAEGWVMEEETDWESDQRFPHAITSKGTITDRWTPRHTKVSTPVTWTISGNSIVITATPVNMYVLEGYKFTFMVDVTCTFSEISDTNHYPYANENNRKGYYQQLELQQTGSEVALYPQKVVQENFNTELMHPANVAPLYMQPFSAKYPQKIQLEVMFQNLVHFQDNGTPDNAYVDLCVGYSLDGGASYQPFTAFIQGTNTISITDLGTVTTTDGTYRKTRFYGAKNKAMRFIAEKTFTFAEVFNIPNGTTKLKNNVIEFKIWRDSVDVSITESKYQYKCFFSAIRTWCYDYKETLKQYETYGTQSLVAQSPMPAKYRNMTARLGFTIRAGDEISGTIDELNVVMMSRARYCTITEDEYGEKTYTWSGAGQTNPYDVAYTVPTNNPASLALMVLQHEMRGEYAYTDDQIDMVSFGKFYEWCEQTGEGYINSEGRKYTANGVLSRQMKTIELVNQILNCGHGKLVINGNKYGVLYDKPDYNPVMVLNNQNVLEAKNTKNFAEEIDGYSCKFIDCLNNYQQDTQIFVPSDVRDPQSPNYKDPSEYKLENIELPWITDVKRAYQMCMYMLACRRLRPETWEVKMSVDGSLLDVGSIVTYQSDTLAVGIGDGAQITQVNYSGGDVESIEVDYGFNVTDKTKDYGIKIQHTDTTDGLQVFVYKLAKFTSTGTKTLLTFAEAIDEDVRVKPAEGDIVSFGLYEKESTDAIVLTKKGNNDGTFTFVLVPYQKNIYDAELGVIPEFESNVTSPKDAGVEVSEELPPVTLDQVGEVAEAVMNEGTDTPPSAPTNLNAVAEEIGVTIKWTPVANNGLNNTIKHYVVEISKDSGTTWTALGTTFNSDYTYVFKRTGEGADGYPEGTAPQQRETGVTYLSDYRFRIKAVNIYGYESSYVSTTVNVNDYGTWKIPALSVIKEVVDRTIILTAVYTGTVPKIYGHNRLKVWIKRVGNLDNEGGQSFNQILGITPDDTWYMPEFNLSVQPSETAETEKNYHHFEEGTASTDPYISDSYKISHTLPLIGQNARLYKGNTLLGFVFDELDAEVPSITTVTEAPASPVENQIILYDGTTDEDFTNGKYYIYQEEEWSEVAEDYVIKYNGDSTTDYATGHYYILEEVSSELQWTELTKKTTIVPTEYLYKLEMFNESGASRTVSPDTSVTALCTNIADIVHSHEHYKDLYVEKLSAISANIGVISEGGMGSFADKLNYWALSNLSPEDSGVAEGIKRGAFRVGGTDQYFKVEPDPDDPSKFNIELRAGSINLTTETDKEGFVAGTRIFEGDPDESSRSLLLTSGGMLAQTRTKTGNVWGEWVTTARIEIDKRDNLIITNAEDTPDFGITVDANDVIYHFDSDATKNDEEVSEGQTASNPQGISCDGVTVANTETALLNPTSSPRSLSGTVSKTTMSSFTGNIVFFNKADKIVTSGKGITVDGEVETAIPLLTGYNEAMRETSTIDSSKTVGAYLGLNQTQVTNGIFY